MLDVVEMRVCTTTKEPHSLYIRVVAWCRHVNVAKFVTPPRTAVLRSRGGVTHSGETRLSLFYKTMHWLILSKNISSVNNRHSVCYSRTNCVTSHITFYFEQMRASI